MAIMDPRKLFLVALANIFVNFGGVALDDETYITW